jgi:DNA-nicking Smr family endonuclease
MRDWSLPPLGGIQNMSEPIPLPIDGVLDLHAFRPRDVKEVVTEYLRACREKGILEVRVIHGKGIGQLRQTVHALLQKHPDVISFDLAGEAYGGAGATFVQLRPPTRSSSPSP